MKSKDIISIIKTFAADEANSILIDGPWGCGKTHQVRDWLNRYENKNKKGVHYISLFGLESIDEINTAVYQSFHPKVFLAKKYARIGFNLISKSIQSVPYASHGSGLADAISNSIGDLSEEKIKKNGIVIFDDLERISEKVSFISLMGYFDSLFRQKIKIICLCSSKDINESRKKEFFDYREKIFDKIYLINETEEEIIKNMFGVNNEVSWEIIVPLFINNIRTAKRTSFLFKTLQKHYSKHKSSKLNIPSDNALIINSLNVIRIAIANKEINRGEEPSAEADGWGVKMLFDENRDIFGTEIASSFYSVFKDDKAKTFNSDLTVAILSIFLHNDFTKYNKLIGLNLKQKSLSILEKEFFFLSDNDRKLYINEVLSIIKDESYVLTQNHIKPIANVLFGSDLLSDEHMITKVCKRLLTIEKNSRAMNALDQLIELEHFSDKTPHKTAITDKLKEEREKIKIQESIDLIKKLTENTIEYRKISDLLYECNHGIRKVNDAMKELFVINNFFLPDLSKTIDYDEWNFCHEISQFSKINSLKNELLKVFGNQLINCPNSESLKNRLNFLTNEYKLVDISN